MSEALAQFHFIRPWWLLLVIPAVAVWWTWQRRTDPLRGWRQQMDPTLLEALVSGERGPERFRAISLLAAWLLAVIAVAGPTWKPEPNPFAEDGSPMVVLLKADVSMDNSDLAPSRMERARLKVADLALARKGQALGLIAYAGSAHLVLPPTKDTAVVSQMAAQISPEIMPAPGDRLDLALAMAEDLLSQQETPGSILVMADSVDGDVSAATGAKREQGNFPLQFLALNTPDSSEDEALRSAAKSLRAGVEALTPDDTDINTLVRRAARPPVSHRARKEFQTRWQEGGWYLLPVLVGLAAFAFRRESAKKTVPRSGFPAIPDFQVAGPESTGAGQ